MSEVIVIISGEGGVGKTTTSANIRTGLTPLDMRVVLIDMDTGLRSLDVVMGLENRAVYNLVDVVEGNCRMEQALIRDRKYLNLYLLPSAQTRDKSAVNLEQMIKLVDDLRGDLDYILLDCPVGIEQSFRNAIVGADRASAVTTPEMLVVRGADWVIGFLEPTDIGQVELIANRVRMDTAKRGDMTSIDDVMDILAIPMLGATSDDEAIVIPTNQGEPLVGMSSPSGQVYLDICKRLSEEETPLTSPDVSCGIFSRLSPLLRRA